MGANVQSGGANVRVAFLTGGQMSINVLESSEMLK